LYFCSLIKKKFKIMKKISLALLALGFLSITFQSCTTDPCKDKSATTLCNGKGTLVSNTNSCDCSCNVPNWGTDCSKTYNGTYAASADSYNGNAKNPYNVTLSIVSTSVGNSVTLIGAFPYVYGGAGQTFTGSLSSDGKTITIPEQDPSNPSLGYKISAVGTITNNGSKGLVTWSTVTVKQTSSGNTLPITGSWLQN
jgi:hypothetical protein